jgi:bifunctional enzyme CysN/CysC
VVSIYITDKPADNACAGQAVTIQLDREIDLSRGSVLVCDEPDKKDSNLPQLSSMFTASILWMDTEELIPGRHYWLKCGTKTIPATVLAIKHKLDINSGKHLAANTLHKNEIAAIDLSLSEHIVFNTFEKSRALGAFILINRISNMTAACGTITHSLRRSSNVVWKDTEITPIMRADIKAQKPLTLWFTGLSGAGKTVLANALEKKLYALGKHTMLLDGDNIRHGLNKNLGFNEHDRVENIRRVAEVAKLMNDAGLIVLAALISPFESDRNEAANIIGESFTLLHISTPLEVCETRDVKGLYAKARRGEITNFTGITDPYEIPKNSDCTIDTSGCSIDEAVEILMKKFF